MSNLDRLRNNLVNNFYDNTTMLDVALNVEGFLSDDAMVYPYKNWFKGELVSGPFVEKYNVVVILRYNYTEMPDPKGGKVLTNFGVKVYYKHHTEEIVDVEKSEKLRKKVYKNVDSWLIKLVIPRKLVADENQHKLLKSIKDMTDTETIEDTNDEIENDMEEKE